MSLTHLPASFILSSWGCHIRYAQIDRVVLLIFFYLLLASSKVNRVAKCKRGGHQVLRQGEECSSDAVWAVRQGTFTFGFEVGLNYT